MGEVLGNQVPASAAVRDEWQKKIEKMTAQLGIDCDSRTSERIVRYHKLLGTIICGYN